MTRDRMFGQACMMIVIGLMMLSGSVETCASPMLELTEPVPLIAGKAVRGNAVFGILGGSDLYNTVGNLGATFDLGNYRGGDFYFSPDLLTWIENPTGSEFEPKRIVYTLEAGYVTSIKDHRANIFIKHQSLHDVDSFDGLMESYELYGVRYNFSSDPVIMLRAGRYLNRKTVDYEWDFAVGASDGLGSISGRRLYACAWIHRVTEKGDAGRDGFTDYALETGVEYRNGIDLFLRYETLHDIDRFAGTTDRHAILGTRYVW